MGRGTGRRVVREYAGGDSGKGAAGCLDFGWLCGDGPMFVRGNIAQTFCEFPDS